MRTLLKQFSLIILTAVIISCNKDNNNSTTCDPNASTIRQILNKKASIKLMGTQFYIIEEGMIDTKLNPCNLAPEFKIDNLLVTISGNVKSTTYIGVGPCCTENFVITAIIK